LSFPAERRGAKRNCARGREPRRESLTTPQWIKKLGGHAGELFVAAELSKRAIPNALLPENFSDDDIIVGDKDGEHHTFVQVKACHPWRSKSLILRETEEEWVKYPWNKNRFCVFVWLGNPTTNEAPRYWIATKYEVGKLCVAHAAHGTTNWERRFFPEDFPIGWENRWSILDKYSFYSISKL
jgi:hypothetical protein